MLAGVCFYANRLVRKVTGSVARVAGWVYSLHEALWLGVLDRAALTSMVTLEYRNPSRFLRDEHNLSGLQTWESAALDRDFRECASILVVAGGAGREVLGISSRGIRADGCDPSPAMVGAARRLLAERGVTSQYLLAEPDRVPSELGVYDGAIVGWGAYSHIPDTLRRVEFLRNLAEHLRPGSPLLISLWERGEDDRRFLVSARISRFLGRLGFAGSRVEVGDTLTQGFAHFSTQAELERELVSAGFRLSFFSSYPCGHAVARRDA